MTQILPFSDTTIAQAAALVAAGRPVAVATETVYGLAGDATNARAVAAIYAAKGRPSFNPLIIHVSDSDAAERLAVFDETARALADTFWPGPLTMVLPRRKDSGIASLATSGLATIAVRVPANRAVRALLEATGVPLAAPSANASGTISPTRAAHVMASLGGRVPLIIDDGACVVGLESTIVAVGHGGLRLLRPGVITPLMLHTACGVDMSANVGTSIEAPGQLASHYAPSKPLRINALNAASDEFLIGFGAVAGTEGLTLSATADLTEAAVFLFDALHQADRAPYPRIAVAPIPPDGLGIAINDRLTRAAA